MANLMEIAKICVCAVIILAAIKAIRGESEVSFGERVPNMVNNDYIASLQKKAFMDNTQYYSKEAYKVIMKLKNEIVEVLKAYI